MIFDLHCDTFMKFRHAKARGVEYSLKNAPLQINEEKLVKGGYFAQCFAMFTNKAEDDCYVECNKMIDAYEAEMAKSSVLAKVLTFSDFERNRKAGKISAVLTMEDASPIENSLEKLEEFYRRGVRMVGLTWNYVNDVGYPNIRRKLQAGQAEYLSDITVPDTQNGLTEFGKACVKEMNRLGMVVDVSHLSDKGFYDVISLSDKPIMASHSNARGVCKFIRNLTDDMLKKLADNGGITGMNYCAAFVDDDEEKGRQTISGVVSHMQYIKKLIGTEYIGIGSDFDGIGANIEMYDATVLPKLVETMDRAGFTTTEIENITHNNALRVFKANMGV